MLLSAAIDLQVTQTVDSPGLSPRLSLCTRTIPASLAAPKCEIRANTPSNIDGGDVITSTLGVCLPAKIMNCTP